MAGVGVAENLSESEQRVWDAFATGSLVDFRTRNAAGDDPAAGRGRGPHRQVRAEVVCALLHGAVVPKQAVPAGYRFGVRTHHGGA